MRVYRDSAPEAALELELSPAALPRRVVELSADDAERLGVKSASGDDPILPREVPGLPDEAKLWIDDPTTPAPGADAFRWFFYSQNPPWNPTRHSLGGVRAAQRELPLKLRNVYAFFTIYADIDGFDPASPEWSAGRRPAAERALLDRWILSELALTTRAVREHMDAYRVYEATGVLTGFVDALSNWYVRRSRDRFWAPGAEPDKRDALWTLYECLCDAARLLAPFLPFACEELWQNLVAGPFASARPESVHLADYPEPDASAVDVGLSREMACVREIVSAGLQVRTRAKLRVRQPLSAADVVLAEPELAERVRAHEALIRDELNVHALNLAADADAYVTYRVKPDFRALGPRVGKRMPALKAALAGADGSALLRQLEGAGRVELEVEGETLELGSEEIRVELEAREGFAAAAGPAGVVVLHTALDDALVEEGLFREVLNRVQGFRKELDLDYSDRIALSLDGAERLLAAVRPRVEELGRETLAVEVSLGTPPAEGAFAQEARIEGETLQLGLARAGEGGRDTLAGS